MQEQPIPAPRPAQPPSTRERLVAWANQQDQWVRAIAGEVLVNERELSDSALDTAYQRLLSEKGMSTSPHVEVPLLGSEGAVGSKAETLYLLKLSSVRNVNALTAGQEIEFNRCLTVCFGENAVGKTGYVRLLKRLAAVRSAEPILGDIRAASAGAPSAEISFELGGNPQTLSWKDEAGVEPFTRMSAFDSRAVSVHVDDELTYLFTPRELAFFQHVHGAIEGVKQRLEQARNEARSRSNSFLTRFPRDAVIYPKIEALGAATNIQELEDLAAISPEDEATLTPLRERVEALRPQSVEANAEVRRNELQLIRAVAEMARTASAFPWEGYRAAVLSEAAANEALKRATEEAFADEQIPGGMSDEWRAFVEAGDSFREHLGLDHYPKSDALCLYCQQPLGDAAQRLLKKYRDLCTDAFRGAAQAARLQRETLSRPLVALDLAHLGTSLTLKAESASGAGPLYGRARALTSELLTAQEACRRGADTPFSGVVESTEVERLALEAERQTSGLLASLQKQADERTTAHRDATSRLGHLEARVVLRAVLVDIRAFVEKAQWSDRASRLLTRFQALAKSLTEVAKDASEELLYEDFERRFRTECDSLRAPNVKVDYLGRKGQATRRKSLDAKHRLSDILSEGEQKVIALADFLAEASLRRVAAPIVFDDPVNSLDYRRLAHVVDRIVALSAEMQVVVFTHNIWFATELLSRFEDRATECAYYDICESETHEIGVVRRGTHPRWDNEKQTKGRINSSIQSASAAANGSEERTAFIERGYSLIRTWCEVVVEQELLQGVTQRYQPHVRMTLVPDIKTGNLKQAFDVICPMFAKACRITEAHSQPFETLSVRATLDELKADWAKLEGALKVFKES